MSRASEAIRALDIRRIPGVVMATYEAWRDDRTLRLGAGLAYYGLFTLIPFVALTAAMSQWLLGDADVEAYLTDRFSALALAEPEEAAAAVADEISQANLQSALGLIGAATLLLASSLVFLALADAIKTIWHQPVEVGFWSSVRRRLVSFAMVMATIALLAVSFMVSAITGAAEALVPGGSQVLVDLAHLIGSLATLAAFAGLLLLLFRFLSPVRVAWPIAFVSATVTAAGLVVGTSAIGWYMRTYGGSSISGAFGAALAFLTWVYFQSQILLIGVQLAKVLTLGQVSPSSAEESTSAGDSASASASTEMSSSNTPSA